MYRLWGLFCRDIRENTDFSENERLFWTTIHTARVNLFSLPAEEREKSRIWLIENKHRKVMEREE